MTASYRTVFSGAAVGMLLIASACKDGAATETTDSGIGEGQGNDDDATTSGGTTEVPSPTSTTADPDEGPPDVDTATTDEPVPDPPIIFDLGIVPDAPDQESACRKVDFLFVIDNSGSMFTSQQTLVANFPVFIDGIVGTLDSVMSYQVGVVTTDPYTYNVAGCNALSSLVVRTGGFDSSNAMCGPYAEGYNYMTQEDDLASTFACAGQVGTFGSGLELTMQAVQEAVTRVEGDPGECNEGFIRDDALLVIVIITDEADGPGDPDGVGGTSPGTPQAWYDTVVAAKMGLPENVVVLSLINYNAGPGEPASPCPAFSTTNDGENIKQFTQLFENNGFVGGICLANYEPMFTEAIGIIDEACENFVPPG